MKKDKQQMAIWFGLIAGLLYSIILWGIDGLIMARSNVYYPWAKLAIAILPTMGIFILITWLCAKLENSLVAFLIWLVCGFGLSFFAFHLPIEGQKLFLNIFSPELAGKIQFDYTSGSSAIGIIVIPICTILSGAAGLLFNFFYETANASASKGGIIIPILIWACFFIAQAWVIDSQWQSRLRDPLESLDNLITVKAESTGKAISPDQARNLHLYAVESITDLVNSPHKILLTNFDEAVVETTMQVNFSGEWAECVFVADQGSEPPTQQPVYCGKME